MDFSTKLPSGYIFLTFCFPLLLSQLHTLPVPYGALESVNTSMSTTVTVDFAGILLDM